MDALPTIKLQKYNNRDENKTMINFNTLLQNQELQETENNVYYCKMGSMYFVEFIIQ